VGVNEPDPPVRCPVDALEESHHELGTVEEETKRSMEGTAVLDLALSKKLATLDEKFWSPVHAPGEVCACL